MSTPTASGLRIRKEKISSANWPTRTGMFGLYGKTIEYGGGYYGIGMLSKYPYIKTEKVLLPNPEKKEQRALLEALIEMGDDTLTFVTTHLEVNSERLRNMQAQFICDPL